MTWDAVPVGGSVSLTDPSNTQVPGAMSDDDNGRTLWQSEIDGVTRTWSRDPETSAFRRFLNRLFMLLPIENQL